MRRLSPFLLVLAALLLSGCASKEPLYVPPVIEASLETEPASDGSEVVSDALFNRPFREVWYGIVEGMSNGPFRLDHVDIDSGLIRASVVIDSGGDYVDCGRCLRTYVRDDVAEVFDYAISDDSVYKSGYSYDGFAATQQIERDVTLGCRVDVRVAEDWEGTTVAVAVHYTLEVVASGEYEVFGPEGLSAGKTDTLRGMVTLGTSEHGELDLGLPGRPLPVICRCTGQMEREILALVE